MFFVFNSLIYLGIGFCVLIVLGLWGLFISLKYIKECFLLIWEFFRYYAYKFFSVLLLLFFFWDFHYIYIDIGCCLKVSEALFICFYFFSFFQWIIFINLFKNLLILSLTISNFLFYHSRKFLILLYFFNLISIWLCFIISNVLILSHLLIHLIFI